MNEIKDNIFINVYDSIGDGMWDWNIETNEVYYSYQWKKMLGFEDNEIKNDLEEWKKRVHPDDINGVYIKIQKHLNNETPVYTSEHRVLCKNGKYKWILDRGKVVKRDKDGNL
jgi:PAS domain S-box-containing protein